MENTIVPESRLRALSAEIETAVRECQQSYAIDVADPDYGLAFAYYLFFSRHPSVGRILGFDLDDKARLYNAYYWFQRFVKLHLDKCGYDAGLEQQAFKMLEGAEFDLDLKIIEMIDKKVAE